MPKNPPLWLRALKDKSAAKFIKKHSAEFPEKSFLPDPIEFGTRRKHANEHITALIAAHMPLKNAQFQKLAELFLRMPPREIAEHLGWDRYTVYLRIRALKEYVVRKDRRDKAAHLKGRVGQTDAPITRTLRFMLHEQERYAHHTSAGWTDDAGHLYPQAVQDVLDALDEHAPGFEHLEVEEATSHGKTS